MLISSFKLLQKIYLFLKQGCEAKFVNWVSGHLAIIIGVAIGLIAIQVVMKEFLIFNLINITHITLHQFIHSFIQYVRDSVSE